MSALPDTVALTHTGAAAHHCKCVVCNCAPSRRQVGQFASWTVVSHVLGTHGLLRACKIPTHAVALCCCNALLPACMQGQGGHVPGGQLCRPVCCCRQGGGSRQALHVEASAGPPQRTGLHGQESAGTRGRWWYELLVWLAGVEMKQQLHNCMHMLTTQLAITLFVCMLLCATYVCPCRCAASATTTSQISPSLTSLHRWWVMVAASRPVGASYHVATSAQGAATLTTHCTHR